MLCLLVQLYASNLTSPIFLDVLSLQVADISENEFKKKLTLDSHT